MSKNKPKIISVTEARTQINTIGFMVLLYLAVNIFYFYGSGILTVVFPSVFAVHDCELAILMISPILFGLLLIPAFYLMKRLNLSPGSYLIKVRLTGKRKLLLVTVGIGLTLAATTLISTLHILIRPANLSFGFVGRFASIPDILKNIDYFLIFVLIKPLVDEYIFRALVQRELGHYGRYFGVYTAAFLYAISQPSIADAFPAFFIGWYLGILSLKYHSIRPTIMIRIAVSLFVWLIAVIPDSWILIPIILSVFVYVGITFCLITGRIQYQIMLPPAPISSKLIRIFFTTGMIIACILLFLIGTGLSFINFTI